MSIRLTIHPLDSYILPVPRNATTQSLDATSVTMKEQSVTAVTQKLILQKMIGATEGVTSGKSI